jgi:hypothetical protein
MVARDYTFTANLECPAGFFRSSAWLLLEPSHRSLRLIANSLIPAASAIDPNQFAGHLRLVVYGFRRRACLSTQTGIRVRTMQGSPPETPGRESIPGKSSSRSCKTRFNKCAFSPRDNLLRILSSSLEVSTSYDF